MTPLCLTSLLKEKFNPLFQRYSKRPRMPALESFHVFLQQNFILNIERVPGRKFQRVRLLAQTSKDLYFEQGGKRTLVKQQGFSKHLLASEVLMYYTHRFYFPTQSVIGLNHGGYSNVRGLFEEERTLRKSTHSEFLFLVSPWKLAVARSGVCTKTYLWFTRSSLVPAHSQKILAFLQWLQYVQKVTNTL